MTGKKILKRTFGIGAILLLLLLLLLVGLFFAVRSPKIQTFFAHKITESLSKKINGEIEVGQVSIDFFNKVSIDKILIKDNRPDTLAYIGSVDANFSYFSLFQKKFTLSNVLLYDVQVALHREYQDTLFNFQQLIPNNPNAAKDTSSTAAVWDIVLEDIQAINVDFKHEDSFNGMDLHVNVPKLDGSFDAFDTNNFNLSLSRLLIQNPSIQVVLRSGNDSIPKDKLPFVLDLPISLKAQNVLLENGDFELNNYLIDTASKFHEFAFRNIQMDVTNTFLEGDSIYVDLHQLQTKEDKGFTINQLHSNVAFTNQTIQLDSLLLQTNNSYVSNFASLTYDSFQSFKNFNEEVRFEANFLDTKISPKDIKYFSDVDLSAFKYPVVIDGKISGRVGSLKGRDIQLQTGNRTVLEGNFSMNGLPAIKETFISFDLTRMLTDYKDLISIYPKLPLPENMDKLGRIFFTGKFDGFINDFVTYGKVQTALGAAETDVNFKLREDGSSSYKGNFELDEFQIGEWFDIESWLGAVSLESQVEGAGLKLNTLDATLNGTIESIEIKDYTYRNLTVDGSLKDKFFQGSANIDDENIQFGFTGLIDATEAIPKFEFEADIANVNLQELNLMDQPYSFSGKLKTNFSASNIDNLLGSLLIDEVTVNKGENTYTLNQINVESNLFQNGEKQLKVTTDNISAIAEGNFLLSELPKAIKKIVLPYDTSYVSPQEIRLDVALSDSSQIIAMLVPDLKLPRQASLGGNLNTTEGSLFAALDVPFVQYKNFSVAKLSTNVLVTPNKVDVIGSLPKLYMGDSILLKDIIILAEGSRKDIDIQVNAATTSRNTSISLNANLLDAADEYILSFEPSQLMLNETYWKFAENNSVRFNKNGIRSENIQLVSGPSSLDLELAFGKDTETFSTELNNIQLNDFADFLEQKNISFYGVADGKVSIVDLFSQPIVSGNLEVSEIEINKYKVGKLSLAADVNLPNKNVAIQGNLSGNENDIDIQGTYSFAKRKTPKDLDIQFDVKQFAIKSIEDFIAEYIDNTVGTVTGKLALTGFIDKPDLLGYLDVNDVTTTVTYLQTSYNVKNQRVNFEKNAINLGNNLRVTDIDGNEAFGSGKVLHNHLKDIALDIQVVSEKIMGLNTTRDDNELFYGKAYINGGVNFLGPTTDISIFVYGESEPETVIEVPLDETDEAGEYNFYTFIKKEKDENLELIDSDRPEEEKIKIKGVTVKMDLIIDQDCEVRLILDQAAGDVLEAKGNGNITIDVAKGGDDVEFYGNYLIADGNYLFTLQNIINKKFRIEPNSSIQFNGPIEEAVIAVDAVYNLRTSTYALVQDILNEGDEEKIADSKNRVPVKLFLNLTDKLREPTIKFDIQIQQLDPNVRNEVETKLQNIRLYENELNRQVFGLLLLGQFLPSSVGLEVPANNSSLIAGGAANTVSEFVSNQISRYFTDLIGTVIPNLDLNINYSSYNQNDLDITPEEALQNRRELQLLVSQRFLNDRITLNLGGNIDFGEDNLNPGSTATFFGGDFSFEYAFTKSRQFRIKAFTNTDYDYFSGDNRTRAGLGLSYKKEFDKIKELKFSKDDFRIRENPKEAIPEPILPEDTIINETD